MRPPSRLLSKTNLLLPTIREGPEETLRYLNETNTLHPAVSSEDYLLSICHLAHPTFYTRDVSLDNLRAMHQRLGTSRHSGGPPVSLGFNNQQKELSAEQTFGNSDPLEYLYGHQNHLSEGLFAERSFIGRHGGLARSRAHSVPRASSPVLRRERKTSCPQLLPASANTLTSPECSLSTFESQKGALAISGAEVEQQKSTVKQSLISQWISECRSAWREARVRACMLPAIAEI